MLAEGFFVGHKRLDVTAEVGIIGTESLLILIKKHETAGISRITEEIKAAPEYFTLTGVKVSRPVSGVYVKRENGKCTKVVVK